MYKPYVLREEPFGYTFFDKRKLKYNFLLENEKKSFFKKNQIRDRDVSILKIHEKDYRQDVLYSPIRIYFELTLGCNLKCRYCFNNSGLPRKKELNTDEVFKLLIELKKSNILEIRFSGGEPTHRNDWFDILKYAKQLGFAVSCNTNACYHNKEIPEKLAQLDLEQITVSLDGNKKNHEYNRGIGTFNQVIRNLEIMHKLGLNLRINTLINRYSVRDVDYILKTASKFVKDVNFFTIVFLGHGIHSASTDGVTLSDHHKMYKKIKNLKKTYPNLKVHCFSEISHKTSINKKSQDKFGLKIGPASGTTTLNISSHGKYSCGGYIPYIDQDFFLGDKKNQNVFSIWQHDKKLEKIRESSRRLILLCNKCDEFRAKRCQGSKYETELIRLINPEIKNPTCIIGNGPSLLNICQG